MARNTTYVGAEPQAVWATLSDPYAYPKWVVGADRTLEADPEWPVPGSKFKVRLALGAIDTTEVCEVDPGKRIVLHAGSRYFGPARVTVELQPSGAGTTVTMIEDPAGKVAPLRLVPPVQWLLRIRNTRALRALRDLAEQRATTTVS